MRRMAPAAAGGAADTADYDKQEEAARWKGGVLMRSR